MPPSEGHTGRIRARGRGADRASPRSGRRPGGAWSDRWQVPAGCASRTFRHPGVWRVTAWGPTEADAHPGQRAGRARRAGTGWTRAWGASRASLGRCIAQVHFGLVGPTTVRQLPVGALEALEEKGASDPRGATVSHPVKDEPRRGHARPGGMAAGADGVNGFCTRGGCRGGHRDSRIIPAQWARLQAQRDFRAGRNIERGRGRWRRRRHDTPSQAPFGGGATSRGRTRASGGARCAPLGT